MACRSIADQLCPPDHHSSKIDAAALRCTESLLECKECKENFQRKLDRGHVQWASTVEKRRAIQNYLNELFLSLQSLIGEVKCLKEENDDRLRTLDSLLAIQVGSSSESFLTQFKSFLDIMKLNGRSPEIDKDIERIFSVVTPQELLLVTPKAAEIETQRKMRIRILLEVDDKKIATCRELEKGFSYATEATTPLDQYLNVISNLVINVLHLSNNPVRPAAEAGDIPVPADSILALKLHRAGALLGQIQIKLVRLLVNHCHNNSIEIDGKIAKVSPFFFF